LIEALRINNKKDDNIFEKKSSLEDNELKELKYKTIEHAKDIVFDDIEIITKSL
jgi:hypothetical protein